MGRPLIEVVDNHKNTKWSICSHCGKKVYESEKTCDSCENCKNKKNKKKGKK